MTSLRLSNVFRSVVVALVAAAGLLASTPNVHGVTETRGGAACDVNRTQSQPCGSTGYNGSCLYLYTTCYAVQGWMYMTCIPKPMNKNQCEIDVIRCMPQTDYATSGSCTPTYNSGSSTVE